MMRSVLFVSVVLLLCGCANKAQEHVKNARNLVFEKKPQAALEQYRLALDELERDDSPEAQVHKARALRGAADVYDLELGDYRRAVEVYRELIVACPESPEALDARVRLATILREQFHDLRGSIKELTAAISRNPPQSAELRYKVATLYFELGDYQQCEIEAREVARRYETSSFVDDALFLRAQALAMEHKRDEALRAFQDIVDHHPESQFRPHALFEIGRIHADAGDAKQAISIWVASLQTHPHPDTVQASIARARKRLLATMPAGTTRADAFDRKNVVVVAKPKAETEAEAGRVAKPNAETETQADVAGAAAPVEVKEEVVAPQAPAAAVRGNTAKTSVEAAGGTAEEAATDTGD